MSMKCTHLDTVRDVTPRTPKGCEECLAIGSVWVHLRFFLECGHVGCCDDSQNKHATRRFHERRHPLMRSFERGEHWGWCFVDGVFLAPAPRAVGA
jgi:hypothetical protein